ncbi:bifunctional diguanylate cyclase/phosphodiesterase [Candidatus Marimicrobium litorale]|uniref:EAL domain-containing protein n=1 Tax=Candidatus Marimicrobium litorale TaxID=2518991 RepID=A0ABT3T4L2_9GAMM|nr:EAL domain-containing protein [Candidatus Marimicrobium litorale]MCX2977014.1 EAL domain-containing protein [Candidatus Marimicrobium litorale]
MSLHKQLWAAIIVLLTSLLIVSIVITTLSARDYLSEQLSLKNTDDANNLALFLEQKGTDTDLLKLTVAAKFDTGYYELIELVNPEGKTVIRKAADGVAANAPGWFVRLLTINAETGIANVQAGWEQIGTLTLRSQSRFAYEELWESSYLLTGLFLLTALVAGVASNLLLKRILNPLDMVVEQARSIGERRFITNTDEPRTLEFQQLVTAMNDLSARVKSMLGQETKRLQNLQRESHVDKITGLYNREPFLRTLESALQSNDDRSSGSLCIVRVTNLSNLNKEFGRKAIDALLHDMGTALNRIVVQHNGWSAARLNGSDFAVIAPRLQDAATLGSDVQGAMSAVLEDHDTEKQVQLPGGTTEYQLEDSVSALLSRLDGVLIASEREGSSTIVQAHPANVLLRPMHEQAEHWRSILEKAIANREFSLAKFPVVDANNRLIHYEAPVRLQVDSKTWNAGQFLPWVHRVGLADELDKRVFELALDEIDNTGHPTAVNLSVAAVADNSFISWAENVMEKRTGAMSQLWIETPESAAFRFPENFKRLTARIKAHGGRAGIEHIGHQLAKLGTLHDVGLDYLKVDASFVRHIDANPGNQALLRTLCTVGHTIGVRVIAEGVQNEQEWMALKELGIDGATGPGISLAS